MAPALSKQRSPAGGFARLLLTFGKHINELPRRRAKDFAFAIDDANWPREAFSEIHGPQRSGPHFVLNSRSRDYGHTQVGFDRLLDGLDVIELHYVLDAYAPVPKYFIDSPPRWDVALESNKSQSIQDPDINSFLGGKLMLRTAHKNERVVPQRHNLDLRPGGRISHDTHVNHVINDIFVNLVWPAVFDMDVHLGVGLDETLQYGRQLVDPDRIDRRHSHLSAYDIPEPLHLLGQRVKPVDYLATALEKRHTCFSRNEAAAAASLD